MRHNAPKPRRISLRVEKLTFEAANMTIQRRTFLSLLAAAAAKAQTTGKPVNLDEHGDMKLSGVDSASQHAIAGMNAAAAPAAGPIQPVFTRSGSNLRHGVYGNETRLTPAVVR